MQPALTHLLQETSKIVCAALFQHSDLAMAIELRYIPEFESEWLRVYRLLYEYHKLTPHSPEVSDVIHTIEETAFKAVYAATKAGNFTELAPLVSDDFSLFAHAVAREFHDPWLNGLLHGYMHGKFPSGAISCVDVSLQTLLKKSV